jgi:hypothetical protein
MDAPSAAVVTASVGMSTSGTEFAGLAAPKRFWDLCGIGRVPVPASSAASANDGSVELPPHLGREPLLAARLALGQALSARDARARAAGLFWAITVLPIANPPATDKPDPAGASAAASAAAVLAAAAQLDALLALAESSADPVVAVWALDACGDDNACSLRAARAWQRHDPGNAAPWAALLDLQPALREQAADAIFRSKKFQTYQGVLAGVVLAAMPPGVPLYVQQTLLSELLGGERLTAQRAFSSLSQLCRGAPGAIEVDRQNCDGIARVLVDHSDTAAAQRMGLIFAERAEWPKEEMAVRFKASNDMMFAERLMDRSEQPTSCVSHERTRSWIDGMARSGELQARRERAASLLAAAAAVRK